MPYAKLRQEMSRPHRLGGVDTQLDRILSAVRAISYLMGWRGMPPQFVAGSLAFLL